MHYAVEGIVDGNDNKTADHDRPIFCSSTAEVLSEGVLSEGVLSEAVQRASFPVASRKLQNRKLH